MAGWLARPKEGSMRLPLIRDGGGTGVRRKLMDQVYDGATIARHGASGEVNEGVIGW